MSFEKTFCPSPWFHMRINNDGSYKFCRWAPKGGTADSIKNITPLEYFNNNMVGVRQELLQGKIPTGCVECQEMEQHNKISGRQKQLIKIGVDPDNFNKTLLSSRWKAIVENPTIKLMPQDWQIDLGNYCNSGCVFCNPESSSRLAAEFKKIKISSRTEIKNWTDDTELVSNFIDSIKNSPTIKYLHFIGGETLITPAFKRILKELIKYGISKEAVVGLTTNLYCWDQEVVDLLTEFKEVNLGVSIECFDKVNDYVRWPSKIDDVVAVLNQWQNLANNHKWLLQFRTTPTWLTVSRLLSVYDVAWQHNITIESCNFLARPEFLKISVLPREIRQNIIKQMKFWLTNHQIADNTETVFNIRNPSTAKLQILQDLESYVNYLENSKYQTELLPEAVEYLKLLESNRKNSILNYLPEYEDLLRSAGY